MQTQTQTDTHKCRQRHNGQVFPHKTLFILYGEGGAQRKSVLFLFPKFLSSTPNLPKSVAHAANDSSKSSTDMSHTLREGDSSSQTHSCLEKTTLIIFIIFLSLVQIILALQHVLCVSFIPHHLPTPNCSSFVWGSCLFFCRYYHGMVCDLLWIAVTNCLTDPPNA